MENKQYQIPKKDITSELHQQKHLKPVDPHASNPKMDNQYRGSHADTHCGNSSAFCWVFKTNCHLKTGHCTNQAPHLIQPGSFFILLRPKAFLPSKRTKFLDAFQGLIFKFDHYKGLEIASPEIQSCQHSQAGSYPTTNPLPELLALP